MHECHANAVPNNKTERPLSHYRERFAEADPHALTAKSGLTFDATTSCFIFRVMDANVTLSWPDGVAMRSSALVGSTAVGDAPQNAGTLQNCDAPQKAGTLQNADTCSSETCTATFDAVQASAPAEASSSLTILLLRMLLDGTLVPSTGKFIPYAQIPWGAEYLEPFTGRCLKRLAYSFSCAHALALGCEKVGAAKITDGVKADEAYEIEFVPGVFVRAYFWEGDDEFEPRAQLLFSDNISLAFTAEDVAVVGDCLITAIKTGGIK